MFWHAGSLDHFAPLLDIATQADSELLWRAAFGLNAHFQQPLLHVGLSKCVMQAAIERIDGLLGRPSAGKVSHSRR